MVTALTGNNTLMSGGQFIRVCGGGHMKTNNLNFDTILKRLTNEANGYLENDKHIRFKPHTLTFQECLYISKYITKFKAKLRVLGMVKSKKENKARHY